MESNTTSRRAFVGGVGTGIAVAVAAVPQAAGAQSAQARAADQTIKRNPVDEYPRPPFPVQSQPWPALASKMTPRPDHGENTYRGSGRLAGRKALLTGGDSGIGRAAAIAFAREGADVAINYLPAEEADAREVVKLIGDAGRKAVALPGDIRNEEFCGKLVADAVRALGGLDILVNNAARQQSHASIAELTTEQFDWTFKTNIYAMFWITKAAMPHLGAGVEHHQHGVGSGVRSVAESTRLLADEGGDRRVHQVAREAGRKAGHSRERGRAGTDLDAAASRGRTAAGKPAELRRTDAVWDAPGSPRSSHRCTSRSRRRRRATRRAKSTAPPAGAETRKAVGARIRRGCRSRRS